MKIAHQGLEQLKKHLDTNIVVPNQNLFKIVNEKTSFKNSFALSNDVLKAGVQSVTDLMVRPGLINLDFADVETIMKGMGKAMMGTGEAEGEKRAEEATNAALLNPLIDEYSLRGAKGLLVNITGGSDLTLFEVEESVNKIRAEVDPEADLIFGSIEDEKLNGKIRVSIVATSLDGQEPETKPIISMVHRLQNRNVRYGDNVANTLTNNQATLNATEGATALDMNSVIEQNQTKESELVTEQHQVKTEVNGPLVENISMENATYLQNMENLSDDESKMSTFEVDSIELATPELFSEASEDSSFNQDNNTNEPNIFDNAIPQDKKKDEIKELEMFEDNNQEEDFEIPAFLRRQKN
jgi:cell division protein FtsZ